MTYKFSFQKVLDFKEKEKEFAEQEYGTIKIRQIELEEEMEDLELEKEKMFHQYNHVDRKTVSQLLHVQHEMEHVNRKMKQLTTQSQQVHQQLETKHQVLIEKMQEVKMWNQWKTKSKAAFQKQQDLKEQAILDEMAVLRYSYRV
ncbi:flagellar export protein FliJ [Bacillus sp. S3]|uniref:flagellar export protein FliJ n=1 Tax=Bacillus sp. S3 TaxID=486398 RepID=UPI00118BCE59|nr:flagellar export protein FliJ [Bacillus sp. S3]QCJ42399.1 flagellar export protein FliJ [Bacillus sp. S3]